MPLDEVGVSIRYGEAVDLVGGLCREPGTHTHASVNGWDRPSTVGERAAIFTAEKLINWFRNKDDTSPAFQMSRPWPDPDAVSPEVLAAAEAELAARSAFAN